MTIGFIEKYYIFYTTDNIFSKLIDWPKYKHFIIKYC